MSSRIGTGDDLPISASQLQSVLGKVQLSASTATAGISTDMRQQGLAAALPQVKDRLSPTGTLPTSR